VRPEFRDHLGETGPRDHDGAAGLHYADRSGRNDLLDFKVARNENTVFFYLRTRDAIAPADTLDGLWLLIDADQDPRTGWEGFDCIVNRTPIRDGKLSLERNAGGWNWKSEGEVPFRAEHNELHLAVPRSALGLSSGPDSLSLDFKWIDNAQRPGDLIDVYISGDSAPEGWFVFRYEAR